MDTRFRHAVQDFMSATTEYLKCIGQPKVSGTGAVSRLGKRKFYSQKSQDEMHLNDMFEAIEKAKEEGQIADIATSSVLELEYKVAAMSQALKSSDLRCKRLQSQVYLLQRKARLQKIIDKKRLKSKLKVKVVLNRAAEEALSVQVNDLKNQIELLNKHSEEEKELQLKKDDEALMKMISLYKRYISCLVHKFNNESVAKLPSLV